MSTPESELPLIASNEFQRRMNASLESGARAKFPRSLFRWPTEAGAAYMAVVDWIAFPERVATCLGRSSALRMLDVPDSTIGDGGRRLQEEYAEWRVVRSERGIEQVDITTETADYWRVLAAYAPERLLEILSEIANEEVDASDVYSARDPFSIEEPVVREDAFARAMLEGGTSPYNNGVKAIACMVHPSNSIEALLDLAVAATNAVELIDSDGGNSPRCPTCREVAPRLEDSARWGRASDPLIVERLTRLAFEGRRVALDTPGPLAISGIESKRLRTPSGEVVPTEWFRLSRPMRGGERCQRVSFSVPNEEGFCISDITDIATEEKISSGSHVADLIQVSLYLLTTEEEEISREVIEVASPVETISCDDIQQAVRELSEP